MSELDFLKHSPEPWDPSDKHAFLCDAEGEIIATFGEGGKRGIDLNNRNRAGVCVNALRGIPDPIGFRHIAQHVAEGTLPPEALRDILTDAERFTVQSDKETKGPMTLSRARFLSYLVGTGGGACSILYQPTGQPI